jgi:hypothetical protein
VERHKTKNIQFWKCYKNNDDTFSLYPQEIHEYQQKRTLLKQFLIGDSVKPSRVLTLFARLHERLFAIRAIRLEWGIASATIGRGIACSCLGLEAAERVHS